MRKVAIYGKGGIGKSTTTQNTVAALAGTGLQCPPFEVVTQSGGGMQSVFDNGAEERGLAVFGPRRAQSSRSTWPRRR